MQKFNAFEKPDMGQVITVIVEAEADHRASDDKSKRLRKAWDAKIEAIQNGDRKAFSNQLPAWLEVDPKIISVEEQASVKASSRNLRMVR